MNTLVLNVSAPVWELLGAGIILTSASSTTLAFLGYTSQYSDTT
jgi:hypothetical protein